MFRQIPFSQSAPVPAPVTTPTPSGQVIFSRATFDLKYILNRGYLVATTGGKITAAEISGSVAGTRVEGTHVCSRLLGTRERARFPDSRNISSLATIHELLGIVVAGRIECRCADLQGGNSGTRVFSEA